MDANKFKQLAPVFLMGLSLLFAAFWANSHLGIEPALIGVWGNSEDSDNQPLFCFFGGGRGVAIDGAGPEAAELSYRIDGRFLNVKIDAPAEDERRWEVLSSSPDRLEFRDCDSGARFEVHRVVDEDGLEMESKMILGTWKEVQVASSLTFNADGKGLALIDPTERQMVFTYTMRKGHIEIEWLDEARSSRLEILSLSSEEMRCSWVSESPNRLVGTYVKHRP